MEKGLFGEVLRSHATGSLLKQLIDPCVTGVFMNCFLKYFKLTYTLKIELYDSLSE
jgi:hypothetical protein